MATKFWVGFEPGSTVTSGACKIIADFGNGLTDTNISERLKVFANNLPSTTIAYNTAELASTITAGSLECSGIVFTSKVADAALVLDLNTGVEVIYTTGSTTGIASGLTTAVHAAGGYLKISVVTSTGGVQNRWIPLATTITST